MKTSDLVFKASDKYQKLASTPVAFFCLEYGLDDDSSMYAGGLGVLAGDYLMEAADQGLPIVALGLKYGAHDESSKHFCERYQLLETETSPLLVEVPIAHEIVKARVWVRSFGTSVSLLLLDTNIPENESSRIQDITSHLYDPDFYTRLKQQILLGVGGIRLLRQLELKPSVYHLNEGHTSMAVLGLMGEAGSNESVGAASTELAKAVATKHTIFSAAGLLVTLKDFTEFLGPYCQSRGLDLLAVFEQGRFELAADTFSTTRFLMTTVERQNGVSVLHTVFEKKRHSDSRLQPITNGVYAPRWQAATIKNVSNVADLGAVKRKLRGALIDFVRLETGVSLNPEICTIVWARRFASYKRPLLIFSDLDRLSKIVNDPTRPVQIIVSGKAHEADDQGQEIIRRIKDYVGRPDLRDRVVYLPKYSLSSAKFLVQGADIWLNTPERGKEACGTSGMKAALNGALQASVSDGWVDEVDWSERGWILPEAELEHRIYDILTDEILPLFYASSGAGESVIGWAERMRRTVDLVQNNYLAGRMLEDYVVKLYNLN
ncbi:MAG: hypothetical protein COV08_00805 [Candidatus Vogelbacteria bacterium CG10_big_fil_rev_8_21_14_0_10_49_38]|uniref:glycogen phosphorylase n=1 Tax=Candidatus Vogelbacteria bacterium CG10_big_fil_rev_8_21_14_0_10_49_38 TaxID=1975043 RepID=A0A2H0RIA2_9BACT|nr:MAG: hypothetical protein BK006_00810 [bacterium CG10_49_38]PIR46292.1 MAG: hypothetical protein COV08_00805 [Candidatus Vogelbacteria bacterium CG10_big_fil_rev_8_21_14_0_10_49_38]